MTGKRIENKNAAEPLREQVLHRCRRLLMNGRLRPGQKLPLRPMADEFNTGLMPVRDALNSLVADGVLEITNGRTVRVPRLGEAQVTELHEIRCALEGLAARLAVERIGGGALSRLDELVDEMETSFVNRAYETYIDQHFSFHFTIYAAANRPTLFSLIESLWLQLGPSFRQGIERARDIYDEQGKGGDPNHIHRKLIAAYRARDAVTAQKIIEIDIMTGMQVYLSGIWPTEFSTH